MSQHHQTLHKPLQRTISKQINYNMGQGTGQAAMNYPQLVFEPNKFFALGSPIGKFNIGSISD